MGEPTAQGGAKSGRPVRRHRVFSSVGRTAKKLLAQPGSPRMCRSTNTIVHLRDNRAGFKRLSLASAGGGESPPQGIRSTQPGRRDRTPTAGHDRFPHRVMPRDLDSDSRSGLPQQNPASILKVASTFRGVAAPLGPRLPTALAGGVGRIDDVHRSGMSRFTDRPQRRMRCRPDLSIPTTTARAGRAIIAVSFANPSAQRCVTRRDRHWAGPPEGR